MMTKDEAVQKLAKVARISVAHAEDLYDSFFEKPVVPQYVADWYEGHKDEFEINLFQEVCRSKEIYECGGLTDFQKWLIGGETSPFSVLVNMHHFGYEVEEETKYRIKMKAARYNGFSQFLCEEDRGIFWGSVFDCRKTKFTRKELEANGFDWVFSCPGVEVKEVE